MKNIHEFLMWIKDEKFQDMDFQKKEFFNNVLNWFENLYNTYNEISAVVKHKDNFATAPKFQLSFEMCADIVSLKRQYFNEFLYDGLPF